MRKLLNLFFVVSFLFQSCVLYPKYERPIVDMPESWRITADEMSTYANMQWWKQLNDPVLNELIDEALANNRDLKVAISRVYEFRGQLMSVQSNLYPQLGGVFGGLRQQSSLFIQPTQGLIGFPRIYDIFTCLINASYEVDLWGEFRSASDAALAELLGSIETRRTVVLTLVSAVASSYIQLRQYDLQYKISQMTYQSRKESFDLTKARFKGGLVTELEVMQAEAQMEGAAELVLDYELLIAQEENLISVLVGHAPTSIARGLTIEELPVPSSIPAGIPSEILQQRPDVLEAEYTLIAANAQIGVARAQFLPSISLTADYGNVSLQLRKLLTSPATTWQYGFNVAQPIFTGGLLTGQLEVAEAQRCEAWYHYQQVVLNALKEVEDALIAHKLSKDLVEVQMKRERALAEAVRLAWLQYDNGQVDFLNVLDVQRLLFDAQLDLAQGESYVFLSMISLYKALGGGWVIDADAQALSQ